MLFVTGSSAKTKPSAQPQRATGPICRLTCRLAQTAYISVTTGTLTWAWSLYSNNIMYARSRPPRQFEISEHYTIVLTRNSSSLYLPTRPLLSTSCVEQGATRSSLSRPSGSNRLYLGGGFKDETKSVLVTAVGVEWQMWLPWNQHSKKQTRESYYIPYTVFRTKMSNEL